MLLSVEVHAGHSFVIRHLSRTREMIGDTRMTTWLAAGRSPVIVQSAMGHASITTTMGYSHLQAERPRALVDEPTLFSAEMKETSG